MDVDAELLSALGEYLVLQRMNCEGRQPIEAAMRARALQEVSVLETGKLAELAKQVADGKGFS